MASFKGKLFNFMLRHGHLLQGRLRKEVFDSNSSIPGFRERCERGARRAKLPDGVAIKAQMIEGLNAEWMIPDGAAPDKAIFYVHGGGYVSGSCSDHRGFVSKFAKTAGVRTLLYEYRLAPEHPYPAALDDSLTAYRWLLHAGFAPKNILIAGESAGGGLCLATLLAIKQRALPLPAAAVAISPWTDLACTSESYRTKNRLSPAPLNCWTVFSKYYCGDNDPRTPQISPLYGDLSGLPPILINSGVDDELFEDGERFAAKANAAGVDVTFRPGIGMVHCYPLMAPLFREASEAMDEIRGSIRGHLKMDE